MSVQESALNTSLLLTYGNGGRDQIPQAPDSERAILGSLLLDGNAARARDRLTPAQIFNQSNRLIYAAMLALDARGVPLDPVQVGEELRAGSNLDSVGGLAYIASLFDGAIRADLDAHVARIIDTARKRKLWIAATQAAEAANNGVGAAEIAAALANAATEAQAANVAAWDLPVPFREFDLPPFPLEALSSWQRSYVEQLAEATQTPADLAAMQSLSAIAATIARNVEIEARQGWREPLCIFTLTVAESANRKSAVVSEITRPLERFEGDLLAEMREKIAEAVNERRILETRLEKAQKDCAKLDGAALAKRKAEAREIAIEIENHVIPVAPRFFVDDVTAEALASKMAEQGGRIALFSAEGGIFETMAGRYSNGAPNIDVYLKGHAGDSLRVDRRQRSERIERPALTIGLAVQSDVIRGLAQKPGFRGRGLLGRFLYSLPPSRLGSRKSRAKSISTEAAHTYERYLIRLAAIKPTEVEDGEPEPIALRLSGEADDYLAQFQDEIEPELAEGGEYATISEWAGKLCGAAVRLAGILHCADHATNAPRIPGEVPANTFKRAVQIARYLIPHSLAAHAEMGADPLVEDARYVLRWLIRERLDDASKRDIHRGCRGRFRKITELDPVLALLEDHNYLRPLLPVGDSGTRPGRKASQIYSVNPALYPTGQNGHNGQNPVKNAGAATGENDIYLSGQNGQNGHNTPKNGNSVHSVHSVHNPKGWNFEPEPGEKLAEIDPPIIPPASMPTRRRTSL